MQALVGSIAGGFCRIFNAYSNATSDGRIDPLLIGGHDVWFPWSGMQ